MLMGGMGRPASRGDNDWDWESVVDWDCDCECDISEICDNSCC